MLVITKSKLDTKFSHQRMPREVLQNAEKLEQRIGAIKAKIRQLEKQVEEWCAESRRSEKDNGTAIEPPRFTDASRKKN
jgi:phage host-nuclease inhibitor protein Gam